MYQAPLKGWLKHWDFMCLDLLFLQVSYILAYIFSNGLSNPYKITTYLNMALVLCLVDLCTVLFAESYSGIMRRGYFQEFKAVVKNICIICILEMAYLYLSKNAVLFSRLSFVLFAFISVFVIYTERVLWKRYLVKYSKRSYTKKELLIIVDENRAASTIKRLRKAMPLDLEILGMIITDRDDLLGNKIENVKIVCRREDVFDFVRTKWTDEILVNITNNDEAYYWKKKFLDMGITVHIAIDIPESKEEIETGMPNQILERIGGCLVLSSAIRLASSKQLILKRLMDIAGGLVGVCLTTVLTIFIAPAIYISSPGPIFFSQIRVGKNGRKFKIYKFRSMYMDAEKRKKELEGKNKIKGQMFKIDNDPRIIGSGKDGIRHGIGWFIRKTSIDEFPQFWNILKGDMSLVGTRPPTIDEWEQYEDHHRARMATKPGLTGLWQVSGRSNITDFEEVVKLDLAYIQNWNLELDMKILIKTLLVVLCGKGAG